MTYHDNSYLFIWGYLALSVGLAFFYMSDMGQRLAYRLAPAWDWVRAGVVIFLVWVAVSAYMRYEDRQDQMQWELCRLGSYMCGR